MWRVSKTEQMKMVFSLISFPCIQYQDSTISIYSFVSSPESGADVLIRACTSLNFRCLESPSNSNKIDSLVVMNAPDWRIRCVKKQISVMYNNTRKIWRGLDLVNLCRP